ncbi:hypothetical protein [Streptomyces sp. NPDC006012]|uniref:hypothetical protein n=1 Tax=Streptomyces sp. NPDC006012 TaxID=3364739 RepID=UPI003680E491
MVVLPRRGPLRANPAARRPAATEGPSRRRPGRAPVVALVAPALAALLLAAHHLRPAAPYGDHLTAYGRQTHGATAVRARGAAVEAYDPAGGERRWRYARDGRRPLGVLPARGHTIAVWDDGLVTDTDGRSVRWHRALPAAAGWLTAHGAAGVLRPLSDGMLAVVTPDRITAYRTADGDLRWILPAREGCTFRPERAAWRGTAWLVAQPCARGAWTDQLVAVDDLGPVAPHRAPLGNAVPGNDRDRPRPGHSDSARPHPAVPGLERSDPERPDPDVMDPEQPDPEASDTEHPYP